MIRRRVSGNAGGVAQIFHVTKVTTRAHAAYLHDLVAMAGGQRDIAPFQKHNCVANVPFTENNLAGHGLERLQREQQGHHKLHLVSMKQFYTAHVVFI